MKPAPQLPTWSFISAAIEGSERPAIFAWAIRP